MLYQIENCNLRVIGTLHLFPKTEREFIVPGWAHAAHSWPDAIYTETELGNFLNIAAAPAGYDIAHFFSEDLRHNLARIFGSVEVIHAYKLWALMLFTPGKLMNASPGYEAFLNEATMHRALPHQYLETAEEFAALMEEIAPETLIDALEFLVKNPDFPQENLNYMFEAWSARNSCRLWDIFLESPLFSNPSVYEQIIVQRNLMWAQRIRSIAATGTKTLIAVGALHLCGPDNLMDMLGLPYQAV